MMIKTRLSTIKIHEQVFITMRPYCTFVSTFFIPKMFVKWSRFYVITCFSVSMLSRSLIAQLTFFGVFNWNIRGSNSFSPIITIKSLRRKKKCIQCLELIYAMAGLTINVLTREKMDVAAKDLEEEISMAKSCLD